MHYKGSYLKCVFVLFCFFVTGNVHKSVTCLVSLPLACFLGGSFIKGILSMAENHGYIIFSQLYILHPRIHVGWHQSPLPLLRSRLPSSLRLSFGQFLTENSSVLALCRGMKNFYLILNMKFFHRIRGFFSPLPVLPVAIGVDCSCKCYWPAYSKASDSVSFFFLLTEILVFFPVVSDILIQVGQLF